ncbi:FAD binding domain-containing protein [Mycolicibacterium austroafricanum]|uniref:FAD binding domain-containing protein n=1 Tax=Mycolicibacterium austroafricanum TaxID=39687 RepID=UPI001CA36DF6|nr:xanthine dehydrogenase family protein subunit M [Mycolicibacterium austroafricanum]QZT58882.1 xanthine dehydrogenase family protein subunit M [Mycolicibacterium austroafricanum]
MRTFEYRRAETVDDAIAEVSAPGARFYAGGSNLLDLMKTGVENPAVLVDVGRLGLDEVTLSDTGAVVIGSGVTNTTAANHALVRSRYPVLSQAILSGATTQIRNMATVGGNLMQRTRCPYFMDPRFERCNKRDPGSGCAARDGFNREHAVFGTDLPCVAVHPSDMAVALTALDAVVHVRGPQGDRAIPIGEFFVLPDVHPERDNTVAATELITAVELPPNSDSSRGWYLKVRDRHSYAFALVSVAAVLRFDGDVIESAAVALGGVAARPWRVPAAEALLTGRRATMEVFWCAAEAALEGAAPLSQNEFKVTLAKNSVVRALTTAAAG